MEAAWGGHGGGGVMASRERTSLGGKLREVTFVVKAGIWVFISLSRDAAITLQTTL